MNAPIRFNLTGSVPPKKTSQKIIIPRQRYSNPLLELAIEGDGRFKRKRKIISSDIHQKWQEDAAWQLKIQKEEQGLETIDYKVNLAVKILKTSIAEFDLSNHIQSIEDALQLAGVIKNDNLIYSFDGSRKILGTCCPDGAVIEITHFKEDE